jgi:ATP-dependent protease ClpP protease subunit
MRLSSVIALSSVLASSSALADLSFKPRPIATPPPQQAAATVQFTASNHVVLNDVISGPTASQAMVDLALLKTGQPILFLDSPGGSIDAGMNLVNMIITSPREITCVAYFAASMAFVTLQSCHKRYVLSNSTIMQHQARFWVGGYEENFKTYAAYIFTMLGKINSAQAERMKMNITDFDNARKHDLWLYGEDAVKAKAADAVVGGVCSEDLVIERKSVVLWTWFGRIKLIYSKCPLMTDPLDIEFVDVYGDDKKKQLWDYYMGTGASGRREPIPLFQPETDRSHAQPTPIPQKDTSPYYGSHPR